MYRALPGVRRVGVEAEFDVLILFLRPSVFP